MQSLKKFNQFLFFSLRRFLSLSFILGSMIFMVRIYEFFIVSSLYHYPLGSFVNLLIGLKFDLILYLRLSAIMMLPYLIIAFFSPKAGKIFFMVFSLLFVFGDMMLLQYFATARVPLGADLLGYSLSEISHTVKVSGEFDFSPFIMIALYFALMIRIFIKHIYYRIKPWGMAILTFFMLASFLPLRQLQQQPSNYNDEFSMFLATNKLNFFAESVVNHYLNQGKLNDRKYTFKTNVVSSSKNPFNYVDTEYPFLHEESTPDILGPYFELGETPPNIVLIIVESLGRAYSGKKAYLGSFTPFLDSLMENSLYWENCLSTSGRTFEVLPSTLASVPFGDHGFAELGDKMPDHISLISLLKKQANYYSSLVYGGEAEFDNMAAFLHRQGVDKIIDRPEFDNNYTTLPANSGGFTWGFGDREIFRRYLEELNSNQTGSRMDVLLTVAMHEPFNIPDQDYYTRLFQERMGKLNLDNKTISFNNQYSKPFSTILYFDKSIQYFFNEVRKNPSFANTIFIITGDHRMPEIPISTQIDRFHVPLIIYSPMLKKAEKFSSVVTHFDITPSLIALLDGKKHISRPALASWIGHGLDNEKSFRSLNAYPLMRNKNEILDFISGEDFIANNVLYKLLSGMSIEPARDRVFQGQMKEDLDNFLRKNKYACDNNKLIPDSLRHYTGR